MTRHTFRTQNSYNFFLWTLYSVASIFFSNLLIGHFLFDGS